MEVNLTNKQVTEIDQMLRKIAYKNRDKITTDFEDVVSDLWINAIKIIEKQGSVEMEYIAAASKYHIVDMVRRNMRKANELPIPDAMFAEMLSIDERNSSKAKEGRGTLSKTDCSTYTYCSICQISTENKVEIMDILNLFDEGSKERSLVESWMKILGIIDCENSEKLPSKAFDGYIAKDVLGYASSSSNGYNRLRNKVRETLEKNGYKC